MQTETLATENPYPVDGPDPEAKGLLDTTGPNKEKEAPKSSNIFVFWCILASILIGLSCALRGIESQTPFATKFSLSLSFLVLSSLSLAVYKWRGGSKFVMPYYRVLTLEGQEQGTTIVHYEFSWA